jgi:hypothetical protein
MQLTPASPNVLTTADLGINLREQHSQIRQVCCPHDAVGTTSTRVAVATVHVSNLCACLRWLGLRDVKPVALGRDALGCVVEANAVCHVDIFKVYGSILYLLAILYLIPQDARSCAHSILAPLTHSLNP